MSTDTKQPYGLISRDKTVTSDVFYAKVALGKASQVYVVAYKMPMNQRPFCVICTVIIIV